MTKTCYVNNKIVRKEKKRKCLDKFINDKPQKQLCS